MELQSMNGELDDANYILHSVVSRLRSGVAVVDHRAANETRPSKSEDPSPRRKRPTDHGGRG